MKLTAAQIEVYAYNAGFRDEELRTASAIALAESGGDPHCYDPETAFFEEHKIPAGQGSLGLWQIFVHEHPEFEGWNLDDPQVNACAAAIVFAKAAKQFTPWSTYTSGAFKKFLEASAT